MLLPIYGFRDSRSAWVLAQAGVTGHPDCLETAGFRRVIAEL
jgi:hypothetical protein